MIDLSAAWQYKRLYIFTWFCYDDKNQSENIIKIVVVLVIQ